MDDPTRWCENDASNGTRLPGPPVPSEGLTFCPADANAIRFFALSIRISFTKTTHLVDLASHGDSRLRQHVLDLRFAQT